jgi:hypothetical protein
MWAWFHRDVNRANDLSSVPWRTGRDDCNLGTPAGFAAVHG